MPATKPQKGAFARMTYIEWNNSSLRIPNSNKNMLLNLVYLQYNMDIIAINN
jgi:hypothetical protein